ncbi:SPOR domain-containing protein [Allosphingosinicella sp.]|uniref:SPOR domain-containing protein n=1 Tax=Allosphingosinicella sp. TaxID=2823234 RepID=UPI0037835817
MITARRLWLFATAAALAGAGLSAASAQPAPGDVRAGIDAWAAQDYDQAVQIWRPLADRGDPDAQYNLAQAYFLGRGVPQNMVLAEQWYERAARQGHPEATANYGLLLFQNGRRQEAIPYVTRAADAGDPRAQYVLGTALFNGDIVTRDAPRAYALMSRAAAQNLPPAVTQLAEMERLMSPQDRARGVELARDMRTAPPPTQVTARPTQTAARAPRPQAPAGTQNPRVTPTPAPVRIATAAPPRPRAPAPAPARTVTRTAAAPVIAAAGGRWRVQIGAFSSEANARRAWSAAAGRLPGLRPAFVRAGAVIRVQAGPLADRAAAVRACSRAGNGCIPVNP